SPQLRTPRRAPRRPHRAATAGPRPPGRDQPGFAALAAPGKTPAPIPAFLNKHPNHSINSPAFRTRMEPLGMVIPTDNTPEKFAEFMRRENARQAELAKLSGHAPLK